MIQVTETAAKKIKSNLDKRGGIGIRIGVRTTGCSGLAYVLEYVDALQPGDVAMADNHTNIIGLYEPVTQHYSIISTGIPAQPINF